MDTTDFQPDASRKDQALLHKNGTSVQAWGQQKVLPHAFQGERNFSSLSLSFSALLESVCSPRERLHAAGVSTTSVRQKSVG